jgi:MerR family transcriptional regulator, mercuric resistance operon regulatory protein
MTSITASRGLTIGALSRLADVKIETIRYYERIKLMHIPPRTRGGHRSYGPEHLERLQFIRRARALGFGIENIRTLLKLSVHGASACAEAKEIAADQLANVRAKQHDLVRLEAILANTIAKCEALCCGASAPACPVLKILEA